MVCVFKCQRFRWQNEMVKIHKTMAQEILLRKQVVIFFNGIVKNVSPFFILLSTIKEEFSTESICDLILAINENADSIEIMSNCTEFTAIFEYTGISIATECNT